MEEPPRKPGKKYHIHPRNHQPTGQPPTNGCNATTLLLENVSQYTCAPCIVLGAVQRIELQLQVLIKGIDLLHVHAST